MIKGVFIINNEKNFNIAFLGPSGTFTHEAASILGKNLVSYSSIPSVLNSVVVDECLKGIVPIENSIEGSVGLTLDLLAHKIDLTIEKEIVIPVNHNLLVDYEISDNNDINNITDVYSHSQALAQCQNYLETHNMKIHFTLSTAAAAKSIKGQKNAAIIGNLKAAELYGLKSIDKNIQDIENNQTRFIILSKNPSKSTGRDKTSILFSLVDDNPGRLYEILGLFAKDNINLTKIESRPSKEGLGKYIFFVDLEGHCNDEKIKNILNILKEKISFIKILGSYPMANF